MAKTTQERQAFVICRIGQPDSQERARADDVMENIIEPAVSKWNLKAVRSDRDPKPGQITSSIIASLLQARLVVADLTGRNANVYYELAVAHAFGRPVAILVDHVEELSFDAGHERVVEIRDSGTVSARQANRARDELIKVLEVVMAEDYKPSNLVIEVATARRLQDLAADDPVAAELANLRVGLDELLSRVPQIGFPANRFYLYPYTTAVDLAPLHGHVTGNTRVAGTLVDTAAGQRATDIPLLTLRQEATAVSKPNPAHRRPGRRSRTTSSR
jgi:hypothetical protein